MCLKESGASEELIRTCMDGTIHEDRGVQCYIHCLFDKLMVINEETGHIHLDRLAKLAPNTDMQEAFHFLHKECGHILTEDHCLTAFQAAKCYFDSHAEVVKFCHLLVADLEI
ncbi:pheromone-binding protein-related protein 6-like [Wyeomyia smithii]|uniref:pheromone-binding protein-related protein 6-like n=1 Tax=Wyeomyia smithii TaxID=174621 RepID=UPI002467DBD0|nr:pheromone-binding protein-related protein 6-like [Wyeomyia smithii]